jgi:hypothetical protein
MRKGDYGLAGQRQSRKVVRRASILLVPQVVSEKLGRDAGLPRWPIGGVRPESLRARTPAHADGPGRFRLVVTGL